MQIRVVEVLAALSLTTDIAAGVPFEKGLRTCAVATALGRTLGLDDAELVIVFHVALLRSIGCTGAIVGRALYEGGLDLAEALAALAAAAADAPAD